MCNCVMQEVYVLQGISYGGTDHKKGDLDRIQRADSQDY